MGSSSVHSMKVVCFLVSKSSVAPLESQPQFASSTGTNIFPTRLKEHRPLFITVANAKLCTVCTAISAQ